MNARRPRLARDSRRGYPRLVKDRRHFGVSHVVDFMDSVDDDAIRLVMGVASRMGAIVRWTLSLFLATLLIAAVAGLGDSQTHAQTGCVLTSPDGCPLRYGIQLTARMESASDLHTWTLNVPASGRIYLSVYPVRPSELDLDVYIQDPSGALVETSTMEAARSTWEQLRFSLPDPGLYKVYVQINPSRSLGERDINYQIVARASSEIVQALQDPNEEGRIVAGSAGQEPFRGVAFSPDGQLLALTPGEGAILLWRVSDGRVVRSLSGGSTPLGGPVAFSPDGTLLAISGVDSASIWRVADGARVRLFDDFGPTPHGGDAIAISPDGTLVAGSSTMPRIWRVSDGKLLQRLDYWAGSWNVRKVAFAPTNEFLAAEYSGHVWLWRVRDGELLQSLGQPAVNVNVSGFALSPNGQMIVTGVSGEDRILFWNVANGAVVRDVPVVADVSVLGYSPDGQIVATGSSDGSIRLLKAADGSLLRTMMGHKMPVVSLAFSPQGHLLASGADDGTVRMWSVR